MRAVANVVALAVFVVAIAGAVFGDENFTVCDVNSPTPVLLMGNGTIVASAINPATGRYFPAQQCWATFQVRAGSAVTLRCAVQMDFADDLVLFATGTATTLSSFNESANLSFARPAWIVAGSGTSSRAVVSNGFQVLFASPSKIPFVGPFPSRNVALRSGLVCDYTVSVDACYFFPCVDFGYVCTNLPAPTPNSSLGRTCVLTVCSVNPATPVTLTGTGSFVASTVDPVTGVYGARQQCYAQFQVPVQSAATLQCSGRTQNASDFAQIAQGSQVLQQSFASVARAMEGKPRYFSTFVVGPFVAVTSVWVLFSSSQTTSPGPGMTCDFIVFTDACWLFPCADGTQKCTNLFPSVSNMSNVSTGRTCTPPVHVVCDINSPTPVFLTGSGTIVAANVNPSTGRYLPNQNCWASFRVAAENAVTLSCSAYTSYNENDYATLSANQTPSFDSFDAAVLATRDDLRFAPTTNTWLLVAVSGFHALFSSDASEEIRGFGMTCNYTVHVDVCAQFPCEDNTQTCRNSVPTSNLPSGRTCQPLPTITICDINSATPVILNGSGTLVASHEERLSGLYFRNQNCWASFEIRHGTTVTLSCHVETFYFGDCVLFAGGRVASYSSFTAMFNTLDIKSRVFGTPDFSVTVVDGFQMLFYTSEYQAAGSGPGLACNYTVSIDVCGFFPCPDQRHTCTNRPAPAPNSSLGRICSPTPDYTVCDINSPRPIILIGTGIIVTSTPDNFLGTYLSEQECWASFAIAPGNTVTLSCEYDIEPPGATVFDYAQIAFDVNGSSFAPPFDTPLRDLSVYAGNGAFSYPSRRGGFTVFFHTDQLVVRAGSGMTCSYTIAVDACFYFPCAVQSQICYNLPPPALNSSRGRECREQSDITVCDNNTTEAMLLSGNGTIVASLLNETTGMYLPGQQCWASFAVAEGAAVILECEVSTNGFNDFVQIAGGTDERFSNFTAASTFMLHVPRMFGFTKQSFSTVISAGFQIVFQSKSVQQSYGPGMSCAYTVSVDACLNFPCADALSWCINTVGPSAYRSVARKCQRPSNYTLCDINSGTPVLLEGNGTIVASRVDPVTGRYLLNQQCWGTFRVAEKSVVVLLCQYDVVLFVDLLAFGGASAYESFSDALSQVEEGFLEGTGTLLKTSLVSNFTLLFRTVNAYSRLGPGMACTYTMFVDTCYYFPCADKSQDCVNSLDSAGQRINGTTGRECRNKQNYTVCNINSAAQVNAVGNGTIEATDLRVHLSSQQCWASFVVAAGSAVTLACAFQSLGDSNSFGQFLLGKSFTFGTFDDASTALSRQPRYFNNITLRPFTVVNGFQIVFAASASSVPRASSMTCKYTVSPDACWFFPCVDVTQICTNLPAPVPNSSAGRTCSPPVHTVCDINSNSPVLLTGNGTIVASNVDPVTGAYLSNQQCWASFAVLAGFAAVLECGFNTYNSGDYGQLSSGRALTHATFTAASDDLSGQPRYSGKYTVGPIVYTVDVQVLFVSNSQHGAAGHGMSCSFFITADFCAGLACPNTAQMCTNAVSSLERSLQPTCAARVYTLCNINAAAAVVLAGDGTIVASNVHQFFDEYLPNQKCWATFAVLAGSAVNLSCAFDTVDANDFAQVAVGRSGYYSSFDAALVAMSNVTRFYFAVSFSSKTVMSGFQLLFSTNDDLEKRGPGFSCSYSVFQLQNSVSASSSHTVIASVIGGVAACCGVSLLVIAVFIARRKGYLHSRNAKIEQQELSMLLFTKTDQTFMLAFATLFGVQQLSTARVDFVALELPRRRVTLERVVGEGQSGVVHLGRAAVANGQQVAVAVKMVGGRDALSSGGTAHATLPEEALLLEARLLHQLRHPHIVQVLAVVTKTLPTWVCLEFMINGDLKTFLRACRPALRTRKLDMSEADGVGLLLQVCSALEYLEQHGVVHRDVAARNVLVGASLACVKLSDLGATRVLGDSAYYRQKSAAQVPVKWMAPEALLEAKYTNKSDVWSFGVLAFEVTSYAMTPYGALGPREVLEELRRGFRLPAPVTCPADVYAVMLQCWEWDPERRPSFSALLAVFRTMPFTRHASARAAPVMSSHLPPNGAAQQTADERHTTSVTGVSVLPSANISQSSAFLVGSSENGRELLLPAAAMYRSSPLQQSARLPSVVPAIPLPLDGGRMLQFHEGIISAGRRDLDMQRALADDTAV